MLKLEFKDQRQPGIWLVESVFNIGSSPGNHLTLKDEGVSEQHAEITVEGDHVYISDKNSFKGTFVNGQKIGERFQLRPGDQISIASVEFDVVDSQADSARKVSARQSTDWSLMALNGELKGRSIPVHGSMIMGRSSQCDIVINDEHMSRRHAELILKGGVLRILDLNSSNGTKVNGVKIKEQILKSGDKINFDQLSFLVAGPSVDVSSIAEEDDEEATVFSVAPMPKAPAQPVRPAASSQKPKAEVKLVPEAQVVGSAKSRALPIVVGIIVVAVVIGIGAAVMTGAI